MTIAKKPTADYVSVTEVPGVHVHREQLSALRTRYEFAGSRSVDKDILEVACGAGLGLGYLRRRARSVSGTDVDMTVLQFAKDTYKDRAGISILRSDALHMAFQDARFDSIVCFEALYYFESVPEFLRESHRILRVGGNLLGCTVNPEWGGFNPSPFSRKYYPLGELFHLMKEMGFRAQFYGGFPEARDSTRARIIGAIRSLAVRLGMIPKTMRAKELLKRVFYGPLIPLPRELTNAHGQVTELVPLQARQPCKTFKVLYFEAIAEPQSNQFGR